MATSLSTCANLVPDIFVRRRFRRSIRQNTRDASRRKDPPVGHADGRDRILGGGVDGSKRIVEDDANIDKCEVVHHVRSFGIDVDGRYEFRFPNRLRL